MKVDADQKTETGWQIDASALDRDINITLEAITVRSTRMRVSVNDGDFFFMKDAATGNEIINQTTRVLADKRRPGRAADADRRQPSGASREGGGRRLAERPAGAAAAPSALPADGVGRRRLVALVVLRLADRLIQK